MSLQKTRGIVLRLLPFNDKNRIVKVYTEHFGLRSFIVSASSSKLARQKTALLQALQPIWLETSFVEISKLSRLGEISAAAHINEAMQHHTKRSILLFLNEVLYKCLREEQADTPLFNFIFESLIQLDKTAKNCNNFHLVFLMQMSAYLGFMPVANYSAYHKHFHFNEGLFDHFKSDQMMLDEEQSKLFAALMQLDFDSMESLVLSTHTRTTLLENLLKYYAQHLSSFKDIKSLEILAEIHSR